MRLLDAPGVPEAEGVRGAEGVPVTGRVGAGVPVIEPGAFVGVTVAGADPGVGVTVILPPAGVGVSGCMTGAVVGVGVFGRMTGAVVGVGVSGCITGAAVRPAGASSLLISRPLINPYEAFVMICLLSEFPLDSYNEVWEYAYQEA